MEENTDLSKAFPQFETELISQINKASIIKEIPKGIEILREGQFVKIIPIVLSGLIKVSTRHNDKELLLYYIRPYESCAMSFAASLKNGPSKIFALTEEDTTVLLLPVDKVSEWIKQFPNFNVLFFQQYDLRYCELLDTIHHVLFEKMDMRLFEYLKEKSNLTHKNPMNISHRQIANELGTAREVISRVMKKLESEGKVKQYSTSIEVL